MTAQFPERLVENGVPLPLCTEPLRPYLESLRDRPVFPAEMRCTALWRDYIGQWQIDNGRLNLVGLDDIEGNAIDVGIVFPEQRLPIFADWFTGRLILQLGKLLSYHHQFWESLYQTERVILVRNGEFIDQFEIDHLDLLRQDMLKEMEARGLSWEEVASHPDVLDTLQEQTDDALELLALPRRVLRKPEQIDVPDDYVIGGMMFFGSRSSPPDDAQPPESLGDALE